MPLASVKSPFGRLGGFCILITLQSNLFRCAMDEYQQQILSELTAWQKQMLQKPSFFNQMSKTVQGSGPDCRQTGSEFRI